LRVLFYNVVERYGEEFRQFLEDYSKLVSIMGEVWLRNWGNEQYKQI